MAIRHLTQRSRTPRSTEAGPAAAPRPKLVAQQTVERSRPAGPVALDATPAAAAPLPSLALGDSPAFYEGTHHAEGERTPRDAQYLTEQRVRVPKLANFATQGLSQLERAGATPIYDRDVVITRPDGTTARINLMRAENDTVPVDDFYLALEEILRAQIFPLDADHAAALGLAMPRGVDHINLAGSTVLDVIDQTINEAVRLADKVPPEAAPIPNESAGMRERFLKMLKRFSIQAVFHSRDLTTVHTAMGHNPKKEKQLDEAMRHDLVEPAPLKDLVWQLERRPHDPWMENWVLAEVRTQKPELVKSYPTDRNLTATEAKNLYELVKSNDDLTFNCSALNPRNLVSMFRWGDSREDCNVLMDPHRLSPHHNGSSKTDVDFQQRAINFLSHHMPREHMGVRHEQRGEWDSKGEDGKSVPFGKLEAAFKTDDAIRASQVLQQIARDGARFFRAAEDQGFTVPWQKLKVPGTVEFVQLDHAWQTLQANNRIADDMYAARTTGAEAATHRASAPAALAGRQVLDGLKALTPNATVAQLDAVEGRVAELLTRASSAPDRVLATDLAFAAVARLTQLAPSSVATTERFVPRAERLEDALYAFDPKLAPQDGRLFVGAQTAKELRTHLDQLPRAAREAREGKDSSTALVYDDWNALLTGGLQSIAH